VQEAAGLRLSRLSANGSSGFGFREASIDRSWLSPEAPATPPMKCPFCGTDDTQVVDSRVSEEGDRIRRRRRCVSCDKRFTTYETVELRMPQMVKANGTREEFDPDKLRTGFLRALHKRPVPTEYVDAAIERITQKLLSLGEREVQSRRIGEMVMRELYRMDKVAYIRFASVYKDFQDVEDFRDVLKEVAKPTARRKSRT
jgi:transcriptional repressor NrdR